MEGSRRTLFTAECKFTVSKPADGKPATLTGYAMVWNQPSSDRGGFKVRLKPDSANFSKPTLALFDHNSSAVLGSTANGSLRLTTDDKGVKFEADLPNTSVGRDVAELVGSGYVGGCSFAMVGAPKGEKVTEGDQKYFDVSKFDCDEVTVTAMPAFDQTNVETKQPGYATRRDHALQFSKLQFDLLTLPGAA
jgi:hypothetical protein